MLVLLISPFVTDRDVLCTPLRGLLSTDRLAETGMEVGTHALGIALLAAVGGVDCSDSWIICSRVYTVLGANHAVFSSHYIFSVDPT